MPKLSKKQIAANQLERLTKRNEYLEGVIKDFQRAFGELMLGVFVSPDEAAEIARDAVSERIW